MHKWPAHFNSIALEGSFPSLLRIVEANSRRIERLGLKVRPNPFMHALIIFVGWIEEHLEQTLIAKSPTAVLWRAGPGSLKAYWILCSPNSIPDPFKENLVLPAIAKIILIAGGIARSPEIRRYRHFPSGQKDAVSLKGILLGDPDLVKPTGLGVSDSEHVKVIIEPSHRVLDRDMQIPESIAIGHLNPSPDRWIDSFKAYPKLEYLAFWHHFDS